MTPFGSKKARVEHDENVGAMAKMDGMVKVMLGMLGFTNWMMCTPRTYTLWIPWRT